MRQVFLFSSHSNDSPNLKLFCQKNAQYCSHLCGEAAFAFAERENWLSFRSSLTYPNFQITCVEEQQFVRAWSKGQYVKNTSCSQFPHQNFGTFIAENLTKWYLKYRKKKKHFWLKISNHSRPSSNNMLLPNLKMSYFEKRNYQRNIITKKTNTLIIDFK